jgi:hypothetical protein
MAVVNRIGILYSPHTAQLYMTPDARGISWRHSCSPLTLASPTSADMDPSEGALAIAFGHQAEPESPTRCEQGDCSPCAVR